MNTVNAVNKAQVDSLHSLLQTQYPPLYADIWKVGVNLSLRISDLLTLKYTDLNLASRSLTLIEAKTKKAKYIRLNTQALQVIERRRVQNPEDTYLFQVNCNRATSKPISRISVSRVFKEAGDRLNLTVNTHSMRKSRGMAMYNDGVPIEKIAKVLNHSSTTSTLRYLGITKEEVLQTYDDYEL
jgi:integrase